MAVHPIDYRYGTDEMRQVWSEENKLRRMLDVEVALARAEEATGDVPEGVADEIADASNDVTLERVKEIEAEIHHDVMAVVRAVEENCDDATGAGEYIHLGATSNDIIDTADGLRLRESCDILEEGLDELLDALVEKADEHKRTVCAGRTHGQVGVPTTWGHRFAVWASEVDRHLNRLDGVRERVEVGQMSGAVGTQASFGDDAREISRRTMDELNLTEEEISTQVIARDRHAEYVSWLANVVTTLDKICTNVRNMQRTEVAEVEEGFGDEQVGSSTMPHKRNPVKSENVCGLARVVRGFTETQMQNNVLWEERDLTNSSAERVVFAETSVLTDHCVKRTTNVVEDLGFHDDEIRENLEALDGVNMAEAVMMELARRGYGRQKGHEAVRRAAMRAHDEGLTMKESLMRDDEINGWIDEDELETLLDPDGYTGTSVERVEEVVERLS
ncbi:adenylosuccinate lyase [Haladaptatus sp. F3-133]|uniref:Adenylosuccinate lyase n=1 Tax=Halorutilus salinus TaxID=2487751 RepID=A0A9Q4C2Q1_9EURY|nr:adenylosuccinate lyase [Halorutilus salinus]MCX2818775.1 adenylosuccinate lyase [Halorutilus salinus]